MVGRIKLRILKTETLSWIICWGTRVLLAEEARR